MFGTQHFVIFLLSGIALNLTPGQDTLYIIGRSLAQGRDAGIVSVLGISTGGVIHVIAATVGLYSLLAFSPILFTAVCLLGAVYLIYQGVLTWVSRKHLTPAFRFGQTPEGRWSIYRQGMITNLLNPKVALFFLSFLPQFIDPASACRSLSFLFLGGTFLCTGTIWCLVVAVFAAAIADSLRKENKVQVCFDCIASVVFIGLGTSVLLSHI